MKETGILMTPENAQKCFLGIKTQTRRIIKNQPGKFVHIGYDQLKGWQYWWDVGTSGMSDVRQEYAPLKCPYGAPGDRLWVKEGLEKHYKLLNYVRYRSDEKLVDGKFWEWRRDTLSPIHMPKWAARLWLEITEVRVQRLQECSEEDAIAEGIERVGGAASCNPWKNYRLGKPGEMSMHCSSPVRSYMTLWESINGAGSWAENPFVWALTFKKVTL